MTDGVKLDNNKNIEKVIKSYDRFVPHEMHELLGKTRITDVELGDQIEVMLTILFSDIRNFTRISESMKPQENFQFINSYLNQMDGIIKQNHGIIDKFIGDGIMAIFPQTADDALHCSLKMLKQLKAFNLNQNKLIKKPVQIGIGLNTGLCMLGVVGGINKLETTVISDAVNLSSRLESLTKKYGVELLISENTLFNLNDVSKYSIRFIDRVLVKGKSQPQSIYEVYNNDKEEIKNLKDETKLLFEEALAHYHYKEINTAQKLLKECLIANPNDRPAKIYLERCKQFSINGMHEGAKELNHQLKWSKDFEVDNTEIDKQHLDLFLHSVKLLEAIKQGKGISEVDSLISFLDNYVVEHFKTEEDYMLLHRYPFLKNQKEQHLNFIKSFELLKTEIRESKKSKIFLMFRIQTLLIDWLVNHTIKEDKHYSKYIKNKKD